MNLLVLILATILLPAPSFRLIRLHRYNCWLSKLTVASSTLSNSEAPALNASAYNNNGDSTNLERKRRVRYSGKYPKSFEEKYKEKRGDNEVIQKVMGKGSTPAGTHIPIMVQQCLECLGLAEGVSESSIIMSGSTVENLTDRSPVRSQNGSNSTSGVPQTIVAVDCTFGYGGHSTEILKRILPLGGRLVALDRDRTEIVKTEARVRRAIEETIGKSAEEGQLYNDALTVCCENFMQIPEVLRKLNLTGRVTHLMADLGFSSMQIDNPERGFTYKFDGPLDMRMDTLSSSQETAEGLLNRLKPNELERLLAENSDEPFAREISLELAGRRPLRTTLQLAEAVREGVLRAYRDRKKSPSQQLPPRPSKEELNSAIARTMQAIRIEVNGEFSALERLMNALPECLSAGGRVVFLTFHSGEDRRVKKALKSGFKKGIYSSWSRDVVRADPEERRANPRSKCAKLRWAIRSDVSLSEVFER